VETYAQIAAEGRKPKAKAGIFEACGLWPCAHEPQNLFRLLFHQGYVRPGFHVQAGRQAVIMPLYLGSCVPDPSNSAMRRPLPVKSRARSPRSKRKGMASQRRFSTICFSWGRRLFLSGGCGYSRPRSQAGFSFNITSSALSSNPAARARSRKRRKPAVWERLPGCPRSELKMTCSGPIARI
jgi:hypothetical protein